MNLKLGDVLNGHRILALATDLNNNVVIVGYDGAMYVTGVMMPNGREWVQGYYKATFRAAWDKFTQLVMK